MRNRFSIFDQEWIERLHKASIKATCEHKEFLRKKNDRKGYINKKHNLVRK